MMAGNRVLREFLVLVAALLPTQAASFRVSSDLVLVNASVLDAAGRPVTGLTQDRFRLFENHAEQRIAFFAEEQTPVSMVVVADTSGSMRGKLDVCAQAATALVRSYFLGDEFALVTFADRPHLAVPWTDNGKAILAALSQTGAYGDTALLDAVLFAAQYARHAHNPRRVVLAVSDGGDNHSRYDRSEVIERMEESGIEVYAVSLGESGFAALFDGGSPDDALEEMCDRASGRFVSVENMAKLPEAMDRISREIRSQYLLGYYPARRSGGGRTHSVAVKVTPPPGLRRIDVRWRRRWSESY